MILKNKYNSPSQMVYSGKKRFAFVTLLYMPVILLAILIGVSACHVYKFKDVSIPADIKTVKINYILNRARYVNPQLSQKLTDKLKQKMISQTRLSESKSDAADWEITGFISDYSLSTSAISGQREAANRLSVSVHISLYKRKLDTTTEFDVSRNFEFSAGQSLQQAEAALGDEMIRTLADEIFNHVFSDW